MNALPALRLALPGLAAVIALAGGVVIAEFSVRLAQPELDPGRQLRFVKGPGEVPVLGPRNSEQRQIKNTGDFDVKIRFNRFGLRDSKDISGGRAEDIYLVGDSFTFGWGVEEGERVSERLEALTGRRVFNLSMPTGIDGYEKLLDYAAARGAAIRDVILAVSMETDLRLYGDASPKTDTAQAGRTNRLLQFKGFLTNTSALYMLTTTLVHRSPFLRGLAVRAGLLTPNLEGIAQFEVSEEVIDSTARRVSEIASRFRTLVAVLPSRALWSGARRVEERRRHDLFIARLKELGLTLVDLRPVFEDTGNPLGYHFANDPHWKPEGHALAAKGIAALIQAQSWAP